MERQRVVQDEDGNWVTPQAVVAGGESHPPEEVYEASLCALVEFPAVENGGIGG